jgi:hypothetical protein
MAGNQSSGQFRPNIAEIPYFADRVGNFPWSTMFGDGLVGERLDQISVEFQYGISQEFDVLYTPTGTSSISGADEKANLISGGGVGTTRISSYRPIQYPAGHMAYAFFTAMWENLDGTDGEEAYIGPLCNDTGFFIGYRSGEWVVGIRRDSTDYLVVTRDDMDYDIFGEDDYLNFTLDPETLNIFCVTYGYLGVAPVTFWVFTDDGWIPFHQIRSHNSRTSPHVSNPALPIGMEVSRATVGSNTTISTGSWGGGRVGIDTGVSDRPQGYKRTLTIPFSGNPPTLIALFRSTDLFNGKVNRVISELLLYNFTVDAPANGLGTVEFEIRANPTIVTPGTWTDIDTGNSPVEYSLDTVIDPTSGKFLLNDHATYSSQGATKVSTPNSVDAAALGLVGYRNGTFALIATNFGDADVVSRTSLFWKDKL